MPTLGTRKDPNCYSKIISISRLGLNHRHTNKLYPCASTTVCYQYFLLFSMDRFFFYPTRRAPAHKYSSACLRPLFSFLTEICARLQTLWADSACNFSMNAIFHVKFLFAYSYVAVQEACGRILVRPIERRQRWSWRFLSSYTYSAYRAYDKEKSYLNLVYFFSHKNSVQSVRRCYFEGAHRIYSPLGWA